MAEELSSAHFVSLFRAVAPYVNLFRGKTFVIAFGGRAISGPFARSLAYDANLLAALGVRLVLIHGSRPQIESRLAARGLSAHYHHGLRITDAATLEWIGRRENLAVCGPSGTGKTFLLEALGQQAVEAGLHVAWFTLEGLGVLLRRHRADDSVTKAMTRILRADLVVVDDIGLLPVGADAAEGLYRLVDAAYEKRSIAISSNLHPAGFDELMPKTLATATVDRLLHHAHVCQTSGDSVRLTQALTGKGVKPLQ